MYLRLIIETRVPSASTVAHQCFTRLRRNEDLSRLLHSLSSIVLPENCARYHRVTLDRRFASRDYDEKLKRLSSKIYRFFLNLLFFFFFVESSFSSLLFFFPTALYLPAKLLKSPLPRSSLFIERAWAVLGVAASKFSITTASSSRIARRSGFSTRSSPAARARAHPLRFFPSPPARPGDGWRNAVSGWSPLNRFG